MSVTEDPLFQNTVSVIPQRDSRKSPTHNEAIDGAKEAISLEHLEEARTNKRRNEECGTTEREDIGQQHAEWPRHGSWDRRELAFEVRISDRSCGVKEEERYSFSCGSIESNCVHVPARDHINRLHSAHL